ncbi:hypothetical protein HDE69_001125 [Pedobacter cryoconitis]|uniref:Heme-binding HmuY-like protein n=1 Tax=Pedobacter cryoconitis TaxID=188932 RepID=A0A7W8YR08_9SPHI|nr:hypothetical protein [Pedobacter cryoconitis]MBB5620087.1 hypothetical protein [Pedobacter cryoconitis]
MKTNFLKITGMFALLAVLATSCKKDNNEVSNSPEKNQNAVVNAIPVNSVVTGSFTTPLSSPGGSAGNWGTVYFSLANNATTTSTSAYQASFNGSFDGNINANTTGAYKLAYADVPSTTLAAIAKTAFTTSNVNAATTLGSNTSAPGWYAYNVTTHISGPVADRYVLLYKGTSVAAATELYVLQIITVGYSADSATPGNYFGQISFNYKKLV